MTKDTNARAASRETAPSSGALALRHLRIGTWGLLLFLTLGFALEIFHLAKLGAYLDVGHEARRLSLRLAHAHGTFLALVHIVFSLTLGSRFTPSLLIARRSGASLSTATLLLPGGYFSAGLFARGGDPGLGTVLVPIGTICLLFAVLDLARGVGRRDLREIAFGSSDYDAAVSLRSRVLREPLGLRPGPEERAEEADLVHLGAFEGERLVGCLMLHDMGERRIRMRQVAIDFDRQRGGIGTALVAYSEAVAVTRGYEEMVLHARELAVPFYERLGYARHGEPFIEVTLPHFEMRKRLSR